MSKSCPVALAIASIIVFYTGELVGIVRLSRHNVVCANVDPSTICTCTRM